MKYQILKTHIKNIKIFKYLICIFNFSFFIFNIRAKQGFIAFTSILVISAVALSIAVSVSLLGVTEANTALGYKKGQDALKVAEACAEESLLRIRDDQDWDPQSSEVALPGLSGNCVADVTPSANQRTIDITATISGPPEYVKKLQVVAKVVGNSINVVSWQEVE